MHSIKTQKAMLLFEVFTIYMSLLDVRLLGSGMQHISLEEKSKFFFRGKNSSLWRYALLELQPFLHCGCTAIWNIVAMQLKKCKKQLIGYVLAWAASICFTIYHVTVSPWSSTTTIGAL